MTVQEELSYLLAPLHYIDAWPNTYHTQQMGAHVSTFHQQFDQFDECELVILGCGEMRGWKNKDYSHSADVVRKHFYQMYNWHNEVKIMDLGNLVQGESLQDSLKGLQRVLELMLEHHKFVFILGSGHHLCKAQYDAFKSKGQLVNFTNLDMLVDLEESSELTANNFLYEILTASPNFVRNYDHLGFQIYFNSPKVIETLDKLGFRVKRVGTMRANLMDEEPTLRNSDMLSVDINVIKRSEAPANLIGSPNGFAGDEICQLMRYAGMSDKLCSTGIYGYDVEEDEKETTAIQIAQMLWYYIDGLYFKRQEALLTERDQFIEYHVEFVDYNTLFLRSKKTGRWWMQLPNKQFIPCSEEDYRIASANDIPERWLKEVERSV